MNQNLMGLNRNYSKLKDDIKKANNLIQDPEKNSRSFHVAVTLGLDKCSYLAVLQIRKRRIIVFNREECVDCSSDFTLQLFNKFSSAFRITSVFLMFCRTSLNCSPVFKSCVITRVSVCLTIIFLSFFSSHVLYHNRQQR